MYMRSPVTFGPAHTPEREAMTLSVLLIASWTFAVMLRTWGSTFPYKSSSRTSFSRTGNARISFHKQIFLIKRTDIPKRYAAIHAAFGTTFNICGLHVGTYELEVMGDSISRALEVNISWFLALKIKIIRKKISGGWGQLPVGFTA